MNEEKVWEVFGIMMEMYEDKVFSIWTASKPPRPACGTFAGCSKIGCWIGKRDCPRSMRWMA